VDKDEDTVAKARKVLSDSDFMRDFSEVVHGHFWTRTSQKITSAVGRWILAAVASGGAAAAIVYGAQSGWFK
jgi:hypothetical protein